MEKGIWEGDSQISRDRRTSTPLGRRDRRRKWCFWYPGGTGVTS